MLRIPADLRFAVRSLVRRPAFALATILTLALGIGANATIFSLLSAALLRPLPFEEGDRIVSIGSVWTGFEHSSVSIPEYLDYRARARSFESIAAYRKTSVNMTAGAGEPEHLRIALVTASFFETIGVGPAHGRRFDAEEDRPGSRDVVVLGWGLWQRRFGGEASVIGSSVRIEGEPATIIGVMPRGFRFPGEAELWAPLRIDPSDPGNRGAHNRGVIARLRRGATIDPARREMIAIGAVLQSEHPDSYPAGSGWGISVEPLRDVLLGEVERPLLILMGAVGLMLLLACANVANLTLGQSASRRREMATRVALGAGRGRLARQIMTESLLVGLAGGALGCVFAWILVPILVTVAPEPIQQLDAVSVDGRVLAFAFAVSVAAACLAAVPSALRIPSGSPGEAGSERVSGAVGVREILVAAEVGLAFMLLIGARLLMLTFVNLLAVEGGVDARSVGTARVSLSREAWPERDDLVRFYDRVAEELASRSDVEAAGAVSILPFSGSDTDFGFGVENRVTADGLDPFEQARIVAGDYFAALGIPLQRGRTFTPDDDADAVGVVVVSASFARKYWAGGDAVGKRIKLWGSDAEGPWRTVVGIVGDVRHFGLGSRPTPILYFPHGQLPQRSMTVVARSFSGAEAAMASIRDAVRRIDPRQAIYATRPMADVIRASIAAERLSLSVVAAFSLVALLLAAVGIHGVVSFLVGQRTREIGIRIALGATPRTILGNVLRRGLAFTAAGVVGGIAGALVLTRFLRGILFEVHPLDVPTFAVVAAAMVAVGLTSCWLPARRATRVDPSLALRRE